MTVTPEDIIKFWFEEIDRKIWFNSTPEFDDHLRDRFEQVYLAALNNELKDWENSPVGCLALVIVLDQFPLNMYRGKAESFSGEIKSRSVAQWAIEKHFDEQLNSDQKAFLYMPFMHSENPEDQDLSVSLYEKAGLENNLRFARHHRDIVRKYGRFPHRNKILGRKSTQAEIAYLDSDEAFRG
ncbi:DUF924 family protein [Kaarinaea lacus]